MKKDKIRVGLWLILIFVGLIGCNKESYEPDNGSEEIFGTWQWVQSSGGFAGQTNTPEKLGYSQSLQFNRDSSYVFRKNSSVLKRGRFTVKEEKTMFGEQPLPVVHFPDGQLDETILQLTPDSLTLAQNCYDCYVMLYVRVNSPVKDTH